MSFKEKRKVHIFDCTLREGEQAPGVIFRIKEKIELGKALSLAGVNTLDTGFPAVSEDEIQALRGMAKSGLTAKLGVTVRAVPQEIDLAKKHGAETVFIVMSVSDIHIKHKLGATRGVVEQQLKNICSHSSRLGLETFVVAEDSARQDCRWVARLCDLAADVGADGAILCDTVGILTPDGIRKHVQGVLNAMESSLALGIHCHNDFGMATANTITAVLSGVDIITCTVNGIGERAGNAALEEVVVTLEELLNIDTGIDLCALPSLANSVESMSGYFQAPDKPIVGRNVFTHESGMHVKGMIKNSLCYQAVSPKLIGRNEHFVFGKHSGRSLVRDKLTHLGISYSEKDITEICYRVKKEKENKPKDNIAHLQQTLENYYRKMIISDKEFFKIVKEVCPIE